MQKIRVGQGYDVHRLAPGRPCRLGGVEIPSSFGPDGHSDADVLVHALCDALLGAANLRDIGFHFANTNPQYAGINSLRLLEEVMQMLRKHDYQVGNVDCTLLLEAPKVNPHIPAMQAALAEAMGIPESDISIKATTGEGMGFVGRKEGVEAYCVALIYRD